MNPSQPRVLFVDHLDSFSENLVAALRARGCLVDGLPSVPHQKDPQALIEQQLSPRWNNGDYVGLVLSPGPGRPEHYPLSHALLSAWPHERPLLGVCLGHQMLLVHDGFRLSLVSERPAHGRREALMSVAASRWLEGFSWQGESVFYNSWAVTEPDFRTDSRDWLLTANNAGMVAACERLSRPWMGVQFHPESFATERGGLFWDAFVALLRSRTLA